MVIESSQTRTGVVDVPSDPAQTKPQDESTQPNKAMEAAFRAWANDLAASRKLSHEHGDEFTAARSPTPICLCPRLS